MGAPAKDELPPIGAALLLIRRRRGMTQTAMGKVPGAPDFRTLSHWETARKLPSLRLLCGYLDALGLDFHDLQDAIEDVKGASATTMAARFKGLEDRLTTLERAVLAAIADKKDEDA